MVDISAFFTENFLIIRSVHLIGVVIGLGAATVSDLTFITYLKDRKLDRKEMETLTLFSKIVWFALVLIVLGGAGMFFSDTEKYLNSPRFLTKMTIVGVIIVNGFFLSIKVSPRLINIFKSASLRKLAFALGAISAASWYSAFLFSTVMRMFSFTYSQFIFIYLGILFTAITVSQIVANRFKKPY